jgi:hypothetical protein
VFSDLLVRGCKFLTISRFRVTILLIKDVAVMTF